MDPCPETHRGDRIEPVPEGFSQGQASGNDERGPAYNSLSFLRKQESRKER